MKIEQVNFWLFPEDLEPQGHLFEFAEAIPFVKNGKEQGQVFVLLGSNKKGAGEFQLFPSKVENLKEICKLLGDDSEKWNRQQFHIKPSMKDPKKVHFTHLVRLG